VVHNELGTLTDDADVPAYADAGQLCTVLVNLFLNALDAMPRGGRLELDLDMSRAGQTALSVSDTGPGIAPEMEERLFTPFASSKPTGTGLGLSISRRIIEEHGGQIVSSNCPGGGARFTISLPASIVLEPAGK
jgi:signal transduction histidine kinase